MECVVKRKSGKLVAFIKDFPCKHEIVQGNPRGKEPEYVHSRAQYAFAYYKYCKRNRIPYPNEQSS